MSANTRNFWILLTTFAFTFSTAQWLGRVRTHQTRPHRIVEVEYSHPSCKSQDKYHKKRKKPCGQQVEMYQQSQIHLNDTRTPSINDIVYVEMEPKAMNLDLVRRKVSIAVNQRFKGMDGKVVVRVLVDEFGNYRDHKIIQRSHPVLSDQVERFVDQLEFLPARREGKAVQYWVNIPFRFQYPS